MQNPDIQDTHIILVVAMAENRVIGRNNDLPWRLPDDMRHFVALTRGKPIVMGRKNYESIGRALPNRTNIVMTRDTHWTAEGCVAVHDVDAALVAAAEARKATDKTVGVLDEIAIIGGAEIYAAFLPIAHRIELTRVLATVEGDTFFPLFEGPEWELASQTHHPADAEHAYDMNFETWTRRRSQ